MSRSGEERANRFMLIMLALQRLSYVPLIALVSHRPEYRSEALNAVLFGMTIAWNLALFRAAHRRGWFAPWMVWVDAAWACFLLVAVTLNCPPGQRLMALNWSSNTAQAAAALAGAALDPIPLAAAAVLGLLLSNGVVVATAWNPNELLPDRIGVLYDLMWFAIVVGFGVRYLRRQGQRLDQLTADRLRVESQLAAHHARYNALLTHYRALHDTVLATLTVIARGGLDAGAEEVRKRCARDADYVRRLLLEEDEAEVTGLGDRLEKVIAGAEALGLRVHYLHDPLPTELPSEVVDALSDVAQEALNNVVKHSRAREAWLTLIWEDEALTLRVVDRGHGFDPDPQRFGFGLARSVMERSRQVGAEARISSASETGTCLEVVWRR
jgi:signal transduction histidine kinase